MARRRWPPLGIPHELVHFWIIPLLLSEHLHTALVGNADDPWNPFLVLPLVSKDFWESCRSHYKYIFGLRPGDTSERIENIFSDVKELWTQARIHPLDTPDILGLSYPHLASHCSLMNVYTCAAYVLMYFNTDILRPVIKERYTRATDIRVEGWEPPRSIVRNGIKHVTRSYRMQDHRMHRLFMPLNVAIEQCDKIRPQTLAHCVADWLASTIPTYVALPTMLKNAQDLEEHLIPIEGLDRGHLLDWTQRALGLIDGTKDLIRQFQKTGHLVFSFSHSTAIPREAIKHTYIIDILNIIALSDWGESSPEILEWADEARDNLEEELVSYLPQQHLLEAAAS